MIWMGLDPGERRIGVAVSDSLGLLAQPLTTLEVRRRGEPPLDEIRRLVAERGVGGIVIGLPKRLDGTRGPAAEAAERLAEAVRAAVGVPVVLWDERLSSVEAERLLIEGGVRRRRRKELTDRVAAALILQGWLDRQALAEPTTEVAEVAGRLDATREEDDEP